MIKQQVIGHLGKDAVINNVNGKTVINFAVAHSEKFKDAQGNQKEKTIWVDCAYWTDRTGLAPYLKKGASVHVDGSPDVRTYQRADGSVAAQMTLRVLSIQLLGSKPENREGVASEAPAAAPANELIEPLDDLPF